MVSTYAEKESRRFGYAVHRYDRIPAPKDILAARPDIAILRFPFENLTQLAKTFPSEIFFPIWADALVFYRHDLKLIPTPTNSFVIRPAKPTDDSALEALVRRCFKDYSDHYLANPFFPSAAILDGQVEWCSDLRQSGEPFWVAEEKGELLGFLACRRRGLALDVALNGVDPRVGNRGVYTNLLAYALNEAKKLSPSLSISTQLSNIKVQRVWQRQGFLLEETFATVHLNCFLSNATDLSPTQAEARARILAWFGK